MDKLPPSLIPQDAAHDWIERYAPATAQPFLRLMRLDRPIGIWLLLIPCLWSAALAALIKVDLTTTAIHILLFALGAIVMRGAGCVWNDIADRDIDAQVERTRNRPLAAGLISVQRALIFMAALLLCGLLVLLQFNFFTFALGSASLLLVAIYPFAKRCSDYPQAVLGLVFNWGALLGWSAAFGTLHAPAYLLYAGSFMWTMGYDTIYALQDIEDDALVGVRSTARRFGQYVKHAVIVFYVFSVALIFAALLSVDADVFSYLGLAGFAALLTQQAIDLKVTDKRSALQAFRANRLAGLILFAGLITDTVLFA